MVTIKDISKATGYSVATVSKSLNNYDRIPKETRDKILKIAHEMGYIPNYSAKLLKTKKSWTIGIIYEGIAKMGLIHPFFSRVLESFRQVVEQAGYDILFLSQNFANTELSYLEHAQMKAVDGVMVLCGNMGSKNFEDVYQSSIPSVAIDHITHDTTVVTSQSKESFVEVIHSLKQKGHQKIAYIHGTIGSYIASTRFNHFKDAMIDNHLAVIDDYLYPVEYYSMNDGINGARHLVSLLSPPTAILCASDDVAKGVLQELENQRIKVPKDIAVIGFDGIEDLHFCKTKIATIKQDIEGIGKQAANSLLSQIDTGKKGTPKIHYIPTSFIENDTV